jgi:hypothetical protein
MGEGAGRESCLAERLCIVRESSVARVPPFLQFCPCGTPPLIPAFSPRRGGEGARCGKRKFLGSLPASGFLHTLATCGPPAPVFAVLRVGLFRGPVFGAVLADAPFGLFFFDLLPGALPGAAVREFPFAGAGRDGLPAAAAGVSIFASCATAFARPLPGALPTGERLGRPGLFPAGVLPATGTAISGPAALAAVSAISSPNSAATSPSFSTLPAVGAVALSAISGPADMRSLWSTPRSTKRSSGLVSRRAPTP